MHISLESLACVVSHKQLGPYASAMWQAPCACELHPSVCPCGDMCGDLTGHDINDNMKFIH